MIQKINSEYHFLKVFFKFSFIYDFMGELMLDIGGITRTHSPSMMYFTQKLCKKQGFTQFFKQEFILVYKLYPLIIRISKREIIEITDTHFRLEY